MERFFRSLKNEWVPVTGCVSFFGTLKTECCSGKSYTDIDNLMADIDDYIHYYNHERIKLKLNGLSPVQYRTQAI